MNNLTLEVSDKYNVGIDMRLFNKLSVTVDAFLDKRSNMLIGAGNLISSAIGISVPQQNAGKEEKKGLEVSMEWKDYSRKNFHYYVGANLTYIKTKVVEMGRDISLGVTYRARDCLSDRYSVWKQSVISAMKRILRIVRSSNFPRYVRETLSTKT